MRYLILCALLLVSFLDANSYKFKSTQDKTTIIELYTSQGCNSCPPADKWLSRLKDNPKLFKEFIPMAFHVTYWNYLGWRDIFSNKKNDLRQRYYANTIWGNNSVYTPQFVINAKEYRRWFSNKQFPKLKKVYGGNLNIKYEDEVLSVEYFNKNLKRKNVQINVAFLGFDYKIPIGAGENNHKILSHDFVVLKHIRKNIVINNYKLDFKLKLKIDEKKVNNMALVVWINDDNFNILQSTGGYI